MNLRRLRYFVRIVDAGSLSQASQLLHIAQPALSQQLYILESEFGQQLLIRSQRGVVPTESGKRLYAHAQTILRQLENALTDVNAVTESLCGTVSIGLPPGISATSLTIPLIKRVTQLHPSVLLHLNESLGTTLVELLASGQMDMALIYGTPREAGMRGRSLYREPLFAVAPVQQGLDPGPVSLAKLATAPLIMLRKHNQVRRYVDDAFKQAGVTPSIVAEIESASTLAAAIRHGLGAVILPDAAAKSVAAHGKGTLHPLVEPIEVPLTLCQSDRLTLSETASAVSDILIGLTGEIRRGETANLLS